MQVTPELPTNHVKTASEPFLNCQCIASWDDIMVLPPLISTSQYCSDNSSSLIKHHATKLQSHNSEEKKRNQSGQNRHHVYGNFNIARPEGETLPPQPLSNLWVSDARLHAHTFQVDLGKDAPIVKEGAGQVAPDSLAAESYNAEGDFASNRNVDVTSKKTASSSGTGSGNSASNPKESYQHSTDSPNAAAGTDGFSSGQRQTAPSYVNSQFAKDPNGPHGKNITEDPDMSGRPGNPNPTLGSKDDPARLAEKDIQLKGSSIPGSGPRQTGIDGEQPYGALDPETSA